MGISPCRLFTPPTRASILILHRYPKNYSSFMTKYLMIIDDNDNNKDNDIDIVEEKSGTKWRRVEN